MFNLEKNETFTEGNVLKTGKPFSHTDSHNAEREEQCCLPAETGAVRRLRAALLAL